MKDPRFYLFPSSYRLRFDYPSYFLLAMKTPERHEDEMNKEHRVNLVPRLVIGQCSLTSLFIERKRCRSDINVSRDK